MQGDRLAPLLAAHDSDKVALVGHVGGGHIGMAE
jgi:hypothetical protein